jgi:putative holliday junction resolvase
MGGTAGGGPLVRSRVRYLAIDLGDKRTGLAAGDSLTRIVTPLDVLEVPWEGAGERLVAAIDRAVREHLGEPGPSGRGAAGELVVGLPVNMDGSEGPAAARVRTLGAALSARTGRTVTFVDERLTSAEADWSMARSGLTRDQKKRRRDALAAAAILREFLASLPPQAPRAGTPGE